MFLLFLTLVSCREEKTYIRGNLVSLPDGVVYLYGYSNMMSVLDSTISRDGRFKIPQPGGLPDLAFVGFQAIPELFVPVILDGNEVYISGNLNYKDDITVSGTKANDELRKYMASIRGNDIMARAIEIELEDITIAEDSARFAQMSRKHDSLRNAIERSRAEFVSRNPSSLVSAMFLSMSLDDSMNSSQIDSLINRLDSTMVDNAFLRSMQERQRQIAN